MNLTIENCYEEFFSSTWLQDFQWLSEECGLNVWCVQTSNLSMKVMTIAKIEFILCKSLFWQNDIGRYH